MPADFLHDVAVSGYMPTFYVLSPGVTSCPARLHEVFPAMTPCPAKFHAQHPSSFLPDEGESGWPILCNEKPEEADERMELGHEESEAAKTGSEAQHPDKHLDELAALTVGKKRDCSKAGTVEGGEFPMPKIKHPPPGEGKMKQTGKYIAKTENKTEELVEITPPKPCFAKPPKPKPEGPKPPIIQRAHSTLRSRRELINTGPYPLDKRIAELATHAYYLWGESEYILRQTPEDTKEGVLAMNLEHYAHDAEAAGREAAAGAHLPTMDSPPNLPMVMEESMPTMATVLVMI